MKLRNSLSALLIAAMVCGLFCPSFAASTTYTFTEDGTYAVTMDAEGTVKATVDLEGFGTQEITVYLLNPESPITILYRSAPDLIQGEGFQWNGSSYEWVANKVPIHHGETLQYILDDYLEGGCQLLGFSEELYIAAAGRELPGFDMSAVQSPAPAVSDTPSEPQSAQPSDWAKEIITKADDAGLICFDASGIYQDKITRLQFAQLAVTLLEKKSGDLMAGAAGSFTDTSDPLVLKAVNAGVVSGKGDGKFAPDDFVTRQEICVMLSKTMEILDDSQNSAVIENRSTEIDASRFSDVDTVAPWARTGVALLTNNGILSGMDSKIAPEANTTVEQAIALIMAIFNKA